jgi:hypothetical protein
LTESPVKFTVSESLTGVEAVAQLMLNTALPAAAGALIVRWPLGSSAPCDDQLVLPPPLGVHGVVPLVPLEVQLIVKFCDTGVEEGATRLTDALPPPPVKFIVLLSLTGVPPVAQLIVKTTLLAADAGAVIVRLPLVGRVPWLDQFEPPPPLGVQLVVPMDVQLTLNVVLTWADAGNDSVTLAVEQFAPDWLVTVTLPLVGLIDTEVPLLASGKLQLPSIVIWLCA